MDAATAASDFDFRTLRSGRLSLFLCATPDNLARVGPLYALLFQQLVDLTSRALPSPGDRTVLVVLDEFARIGPAPVLAQAFSWVAASGLRLLPVIQSVRQLRQVYGPDGAEHILANCAVVVMFAPGDLQGARDLSERLGTYTTRGQSRSRPAGLGAGRRSVTVSDRPRPLMLPQELMQLPPQDVLVLATGAPPVRGRRVVYHRENVFRARLRPPPAPPPPAAAAPTGAAADRVGPDEDGDFEALVARLGSQVGGALVETAPQAGRARRASPPPPPDRRPVADPAWPRGGSGRT